MPVCMQRLEALLWELVLSAVWFEDVVLRALSFIHHLELVSILVPSEYI